MGEKGGRCELQLFLEYYSVASGDFLAAKASAFSGSRYI